MIFNSMKYWVIETDHQFEFKLKNPPYTSQSGKNYGLSVVTILEKIEDGITAPRHTKGTWCSMEVWDDRRGFLQNTSYVSYSNYYVVHNH